MKLKLVEKQPMIDNVWAFVFEPEEPQEYTAGQYVRVQLDHDNPDNEGPKRFFTNSAPPYEGVVQITTRLTGSPTTIDCPDNRTCRGFGVFS